MVKNGHQDVAGKPEADLPAADGLVESLPPSPVHGVGGAHDSPLADKPGAILSRVPSDSAECVPSAEVAAAIVLQRHGTMVIMEACKLFSRRRVEWMVCGVLPMPGIVG